MRPDTGLGSISAHSCDCEAIISRPTAISHMQLITHCSLMGGMNKKCQYEYCNGQHYVCE
uniref:Uncharacterized protein n=1 Tax=Anguilla anguilla TaxID=7936 RepID=A0A0E9RKK5_ANGAN